MNKEKQIEEMAKAIADCGICIYHGDVCTREEEVSDDLALCIARVLNEQGYRKASEVALEVINDCINILSTEYRKCDTNDVKIILAMVNALAELKKKYTEEGK